MNKNSLIKKFASAFYYVLIPMLAYSVWYLINYFVSTVATFISLMNVDKSELSADNLQNLEIEIYNNNLCLVYTISALIAILLFYLIYKRFKVQAVSSISFARVEFLRLMIFFFAGVIFNVFSVSFVEVMENIIPDSWIEANQESVGAFQNGNLIFQFLTVMIFAPIIEELIFRGILYSSIKNASRQFFSNSEYKMIVIIISSIITSVCFGVIHGNMLQGIYTFILSFVMIYAVELTGSILSSIMIHMGFNMSALFTFFLYPYVPMIVLCIISLICSVGMMVLATVITIKKQKMAIGTSAQEVTND